MLDAAPHWIAVRCPAPGCGGTQVAKARWLTGQGQIELEWRCRKCHQLQTQVVTPA